MRLTDDWGLRQETLKDLSLHGGRSPGERPPGKARLGVGPKAVPAQGAARRQGAPCKCGHAAHFNRDCDCSCTVYCPDHPEAAIRAGRTPTEADLVISADLVEQLGWRPPGRSVTQGLCGYCEGRFTTARSHQGTCCDACRKAVSRALALESDADVLTPPMRRESFNDQRLRATGFGLMTRRDQYEADLRVRAVARAA